MRSLLPKPCEHRLRSQRGQSLIEAILGLVILLILFHAFASLIIAAYDLLGNSRTRITARHLGNERIEEIRNLPYADVGVAGGIPPGSLPQLQSTNRNGLDYTVRTAVVFIDDAFDNQAPNDPFPADYKRVRVDVSWTGRFVAGESVTMITDVASPTQVGGGTLSILVVDAFVLPVPQADVHIINTQVAPQIDLNLKTDDNGLIVLPGSPPCNLCYEISVTKEGFTSDKTYSAAEVPVPDKPHANVAEGDLTELSFSIDKPTEVNVSSTRDRDSFYATLGNQSFQLTGGKVIGSDGGGLPVYKYDELLTTDASGSLLLSDMEWGSYQLTLAGGSRDLAGTNPLRPIALLPDASLDLLFASASHAANSLLLAVTDASGSAIASASAQLTGPGSYDETIFTGESDVPDFGQALFSQLQSGSFTVQASKIGFQPANEVVDVSGQTEYLIQLDSL
ncbi:MAG: hypothetical protein A2785_03115 [Candidatus Chisholmbacteria bacterium RIFCSPHIGHO2_01_FULL_49_18]|uniref:Carboxypeptidase regulatory-like domain-containing protein n=1 Tax=Candidatus Chisholmbacteria bacterium RIFCSPHIGHO2_01_FULL_49_18 TaxID=1797590 RepID=A0A1G1VMD1_9BACT|nr:MAG: hypothetical protein A2785_03115 [Candidatus Chisholmbacteria bacterium RIFCSPHIGHO2_01_FULL_49_18]